MRRDRAILIAILALAFSLALVTSVEAVPPLPSSFYGTVKLDGANVPDGTIVSAWIRGVKYAETQTLTYQGDSVYAVRVPGDDIETPEEVEGGTEGDTIIFVVGEFAAIQTGTWHSGTDVELNLTACSLFGDFDCGCLVDVADIMKVANCWRCKCWDPCYDPRYDMDDDCDIDIVDIMLVVARWGETCE